MTVFHPVTVVSKDAFEADIDRLFDDAIRGASTWEPKCNVYEDESCFYVQMAVPGVTVNHLSVQIEDDLLRVKGERKSQLSEGKTWHARELLDGAFACTFHLPSHVNRDAVSASYEQGLLTITCLKREGAKPRLVKIQNANAPLMIEEEKDGPITRSIKAASILFAGMIGLGVWSAWEVLLT